jgi:hypothetical protein
MPTEAVQPTLRCVCGRALPTSPAPHPAAEFLREGDVWRLGFASRTAHVKHSKGLGYIRTLLEQPHAEVHVFELSAEYAPQADAIPPSGDELFATKADEGDEILDASARAAYRARLTELKSQIESAGGDPARTASAREEATFIERELRRARGLGGRTRRFGGQAERARKAVSNRIRAALRQIEKQHPELATHHGDAIQTGTACVYRPESAPEWDLAWQPVRAA